VNPVAVDYYLLRSDPSRPQWSSIANHSYTLYGSTNLPAGFSELLTDIPATPPMNTHTGTVNGVSAKFWQVTTEE